MKKIITAALFTFAIIVGANAQKITAAAPLVGGAHGLTVDTVDNTESITKYIKVTGSHRSMSLQVVVTKISGTVAGTVRLMGSNDGVNFVDISRASIAVSALRPAYTDTLTCTNVTTNTKLWRISGGAQDNTVEANIDNIEEAFPSFLYYGLNYTGSGTMSAKFQGYFVYRTSESDN